MLIVMFQETDLSDLRETVLFESWLLLYIIY